MTFEKHLIHMKLIYTIIFICAPFLAYVSKAQESASKFEDPTTLLWLGTYNKFRLSENLFWRAEFHYRRTEFEDMPFVGRMAQIYNRHALNYIVSPQFNVSIGPVVRLDFTPDPGNPDFNTVVVEPRIWHEYMFVMPWPRFQMYHRIRIEHRWSKSNLKDSEYLFRNRWRYKFYMTIPINKTKLVPGAFFVNPDVELIMHSGKPVIGDPLEDLRIYPSFGYIVNPRVTYTAGLMYTTGQRRFDSSVYRQRWVVRVNAYISLDFTKKGSKLPPVRFYD
jgi:hypothetical protein